MIKHVAYLELNRKKCVEKWPSDGDVGQSFPWDSHSQCCTFFSSFSISSCLSSSLDLQFQARTKDLQHSIPSLSLSPFLTSINAFPFCWQSNKRENPHLILSFLQRVHALLSFWHVNQWDWDWEGRDALESISSFLLKPLSGEKGFFSMVPKQQYESKGRCSTKDSRQTWNAKSENSRA